jgi:N-acetylglucosamine kinase-like BadF-type ATPase
LRYYIGMDAGATGTDVVVMPGGREKKFKPVNLNLLGLENSAVRLTEILQAVLRRIPKNAEIKAAVCAAGAANERLRKNLERTLRQKLKLKTLKVYPDVSAAFASAFEPFSKKQVADRQVTDRQVTDRQVADRQVADRQVADLSLRGVIIAGTGSVLYIKEDSRLRGNDNPIKIGGWGRIIGDEGSGYWIAKEALRKVTQHYDGRGTCKQFAAMLKKKFKLSPENLVKKIYHDNFEISKIAGTVFRCAESGDDVSKGIIKQAAQLLADHLIPLKKKKFKLAMCGSLFSEETLLEKYFREIVRKKFPGIELIKPKLKPVWGALRLAMKE